MNPRFITALSRTMWRRIILSFFGLIVPVYGFVQLVDEVREQETLAFDEGVLLAINSIATPWLDAFMLVMTSLGGPIGVSVIAVGMTALLWVRRRRDAFLVAVGTGGAVLMNLLLKAVFQRDRPELWERLVTESSFSFPSGHAMASSALALVAVVAFWPTRWRWLVLALGASYMMLIGFSRLYLGVHYPTDILAGWMVSAAWVTLVTLIIRYRVSLVGLLKRQGRASR